MYFRVKPVLFYLIKKSNKNNLNKYTKYISIFVGIMRGYMPTTAYLEKWSFFPGETIREKVVLLILNFTLINFYYYITRFILQCIVDFKRKIFLMKALNSMVSNHKVHANKRLPTINILDPTSAMSWIKMRKIVRNYGYNMTVRHSLFINALFMYMVMVYITNWIVGLNLVHLEKSYLRNLSPFLKMDYSIFSILILILLFTIARLNGYYDEHLHSLQHSRDILFEIITFQRHYVGTGKDKVDLFRF